MPTAYFYPLNPASSRDVSAAWRWMRTADKSPNAPAARRTVNAALRIDARHYGELDALRAASYCLDNTVTL